MDPVRNPYQPGAGTPPPELAGRDDLLHQMRVAMERLKIGRHDKSILIVGLRGVGKTVLLDRIRTDAESLGLKTMRLEAPEGRSLPAVLAPQLKMTLLDLSNIERAKKYAERALKALKGFISGLKVKHSDIEVRLDISSEPGLADNGDLEHDLAALLEVAGVAAREASTGIIILIDELQYVEEDQLASLITALHRTSQLQLPVMLVGAGLPQLRGRMGRAKSYAERMFDFPEIGPLSKAAATQALKVPAKNECVDFTNDAINSILDVTKCYPYFLQEWGKHVWNIAPASPIQKTDVSKASELVTAKLDESFFRVRFDRLTPAEKRYLRAMAELGPGPHRSGDIANVLRRNVQSLGPVRSKLITKGMIWSQTHGDTAFTVPLFHEFMLRIYPSDT
jgi:GTPase SAR1 family protein